MWQNSATLYSLTPKKGLTVLTGNLGKGTGPAQVSHLSWAVLLRDSHLHCQNKACSSFWSVLPERWVHSGQLWSSDKFCTEPSSSSQMEGQQLRGTEVNLGKKYHTETIWIHINCLCQSSFIISNKVYVFASTCLISILISQLVESRWKGVLFLLGPKTGPYFPRNSLLIFVKPIWKPPQHHNEAVKQKNPRGQLCV